MRTLRRVGADLMRVVAGWLGVSQVGSGNRCFRTREEVERVLELEVLASYQPPREW